MFGTERQRFPIMLFGGGAGGDGAGGAAGGGVGGVGDPGGGAGGAGGAGGPSFWSTALTGEYAPLAAEKSLADIKGTSWEEVGPILAKTMVSGQKLIGNSVQIPKPGADGKIDPAAQRAFLTKLGVPENVEGYKEVKLQPIEGLGAINETLVAQAKPEFLKMGFTPQQAQDVLNLYGKVTSQQRKDLATAWLGEQAVLEEKWGSLNYDANVEGAKRVLNKYFPDTFRKLLSQSQLDMHSGMIEGLYEISKHLGEARFIEGSEPTVEDNSRMEEQIRTKRTERDKLNEGSTGWKTLNAEIEDLYKRRYGTAQVTGAVQTGAQR